MARGRGRGRGSRRGAERRWAGRADWWVAAAVGLLLVGAATLRYLERHPAVLAVALVVLLVVGAFGGWAWQAHLAAGRRRELVRTASITMTDGLTGPQFEHWVATLMRRTGFTAVEVCGGAGDLGADILAVSPDRQRVVVQCKCLRADRAVGSPDVQRFAGTARALHHAEVAVIVTTGRFSAPAAAAAARLGLALVDRGALAVWAAEGVSPAVFSDPR